MAKSINGNPEVDVLVVELGVDIQNILTIRNLKNCDKKILKDTKRLVEHALADVNYILTEKIEQQVGGVQGSLAKYKNQVAVIARS